MDTHNIRIQEVDFIQWLEGRLTNGIRNQREYRSPEGRIGYGLVIDPLQYKSFIKVFEDLKPEDSWIDNLCIYGKEKEPIKIYDQSSLPQIINGNNRPGRKRLISLLEEAEKISLGIKSGTWKSIDHFYFRKNDSGVYSTSLRIKPVQLDKFGHWGFYDPKIFFVKADFFPGYNGGSC